MHLFPSDISFKIPERFTDPFRYSPHPLVSLAADMLMRKIADSKELSAYFAEGKMLGVLVASDTSGQIGYLSAFSGNVAGHSHLEGFVPPIFDILDPSGHFKIKEAEITKINTSIYLLENSQEIKNLRQVLSESEYERDEEIGLMKAQMAVSKKARNENRRGICDPSLLVELTRESQFEKAELKRLKLGWEENISTLKEDIRTIQADYIVAAKKIMFAGFDGIELCIGNNFYLSRVMNPFENTRSDNYGGNTYNRVRMVLEIIKLIKKTTGLHVHCKVNLYQDEEDSLEIWYCV